ncbi:MAG: hypothetical protein ACREV5_18390, partial [Steroidobacter sp.]
RWTVDGQRRRTIFLPSTVNRQPSTVNRQPSLSVFDRSMAAPVMAAAIVFDEHELPLTEAFL